MAYTGAGTKQNPYIVNNWEDFKSLCHRSGRYIAFDPNAENKVIDISTTSSREGLTDYPFFLYSHVNGNGWEIRNFCTNGQSIQCSENTIEDLHFVNMICSGEAAFTISGFFTNCTFSAVLTDRACFLQGMEHLAASFTNCSFRLHLRSTKDAVLFSGKPTVSGCLIHLTGSTEGVLLTDKGLLSDCSVTGTLSLTGGTMQLDSAQNCVFTPVLSGTGVVLASGNTAYRNLVDVSLISSELSQNIIGFGWYPLTTELMQDADHLINTVKFPCSEVV